MVFSDTDEQAMQVLRSSLYRNAYLVHSTDKLRDSLQAMASAGTRLMTSGRAEHTNRVAVPAINLLVYTVCFYQSHGAIHTVGNCIVELVNVLAYHLPSWCSNTAPLFFGANRHTRSVLGFHHTSLECVVHSERRPQFEVDQRA
jgi:hypothetical protein